MRKPSRIPKIIDFVTCAGNRKKKLYTPRFNGETIVLSESGSIDVQDSINSYAPYCDLRYMLSRLKVGDSSVLSTRPPTYGDFTLIPRNPIDTLNLIHDVERRFGSVPEDIRKECNNDWRIYFTRLCAGDFQSAPSVSSDISTPVSPDPKSLEVK